MSPNTCLLDQDNFSVEQMVNHKSLGNSIKVIDVYDLTSEDLSAYFGLIIPGIVDQEFLSRKRQIIKDFLNKKRVVVFNGHLFRSWLPGASNFIPKKITSFEDYAVKIIKGHPIFRGVLEKDLTFRKGVAGFFARGHHIPPEGSDIIITFNTGEPILYIDRKSTMGTILVHSGNDLLGYNDEGSSSSGLIARQLIRWIQDEFNDLNGVQK